MTNWLIIGEVIYVIVVVLVCMKIIADTRRVTKPLAYVLFAIFVPTIGILF